MKKLSIVILLAIIPFCLLAQKKDVLITIGDKDNRVEVTKEEFIRAYSKNNNWSKVTEDALREYLDLYTQFKIKVLDGEIAQIDTARPFISEYNSYRAKSAQQYLIDKEVTNTLINEAKDRLKWHVNAAHLLLNCKEGADPKDTLAVYNRILDIREQIMNKKLSFADAAVAFSDDISAQDRQGSAPGKIQYGNKGDLGYFTAFELIYPFECAAYSLEVGEVSMPIRTSYGYHIIHLKDKIPAIESVKIDQIFFRDSTAREGQRLQKTNEKINAVHQAFAAGKSFEELAKSFSDDQRSAEKGGEMAPFSISRRNSDFIRGIVRLKEGQISDAYPSNIGWHIVRIDSVKYVDVNSPDLAYAIPSKILRDSRSIKSKESLVEKLKKKYKYNDKHAEAALEYFAKNIPADYFSNKQNTFKLNSLKGIEKLKPLCTFDGHEVYAKEFADFIDRFQMAKITTTVYDYLEERFPIFVMETMLRYENLHLEEKYPEFKDLVQEYHDGMILYEQNMNNVWNKAIEDTVGLEACYERIKTNYPIEAENGQVTYQAFEEIRAAVITQYQEELEKTWMAQLRNKYPVRVNEELFKSIVK